MQKIIIRLEIKVNEIKALIKKISTFILKNNLMEADIIGLNKIIDCVKKFKVFLKLAVYRYPQK